MPKLYGYARLSVVPATGVQPISIEAQKANIERAYDSTYKMDYEWGGIFADEATSGILGFTERPAGLRLSNELQAGDIVLFPKVDRAFRSSRDLLNLVHDWKTRGIRCAFLDLGIDTATPEGELALTVMVAFATFERQRLLTRSRESMEYRIRNGMAIGGKPPLCWKYGGQKGQRYLVPDYEGWWVCQKLYEMRQEGYTTQQLVLWLYKSGFRHRPSCLSKKQQRHSRAKPALRAMSEHSVARRLEWMRHMPEEYRTRDRPPTPEEYVGPNARSCRRRLNSTRGYEQPVLPEGHGVPTPNKRLQAKVFNENDCGSNQKPGDV